MLLQSQEASWNERNAVRQYVDRGSSSCRAECQKSLGFFFLPFLKSSEAGKRFVPVRKKRELGIVKMHDQTGASTVTQMHLKNKQPPVDGLQSLSALLSNVDSLMWILCVLLGVTGGNASMHFCVKTHYSLLPGHIFQIKSPLLQNIWSNPTELWSPRPLYVY